MLLDIFVTIVVPIFILVGLGFLADRIFDLDIKTLTRLNLYIFSPPMIFALVLESDLRGSDIVRIVAYSTAHLAILYLVSWGLFSLPLLRERRAVLTAGTLFCNAGNYGIPVVVLAFGKQAVAVQAIVIMMQILSMFTVGFILFGASGEGLRGSIRRLLQVPTLYAIPLGFLARSLNLSLPDTLQVPLDYLTGGFVAVALLTLGAQLSKSQIGQEFGMVSVVAVMRLIISPLVAFGLALVFRFDPSMAAILIVAAGLPVAVNVFIIAAEFEEDPGLASRMIFWTTLISAGSIPALLLLVR